MTGWTVPLKPWSPNTHMSGKLFDKYGAILQEDVDVLEACLSIIASACKAQGRFAKICEIGMHDGNTARGIENFLKAQGVSMTYWGIDPLTEEVNKRPRYRPANCLEIIGDSAEVFNQVPDQLDLVWVDGCHCRNHVILDTVNYESKVRPGGFICYHDINPFGQGLLNEHQYHGPNIPEFALAVTEALRLIRFPWAPWQFFDQKYPTPEESQDCGTLAFRKDLCPT